MNKQYLHIMNNACLSILQDIEIKKPQGAQPFAFLQFSDIDSVVRARRKLDGEVVGKNKVKVECLFYFF